LRQYRLFIYTVQGLPNVNAGVYPGICINAAPVALNGSPAGGSWSGTGVVGSTFDPSLSGTGLHQITYTYSDSTGCSSAAVTNIVVNALPVVNAGIYAVCA
jgi:hypothetical protein